ncbi:Ornithine decarboxylase antizyme [Gryllus bimaculatus]|nr:Ornithine decarboxylase antizyme [Gryllus bimaculatus]
MKDVCRFVRLLEYAEDVLNCEQIIVCFCKDRPDRALLVRTFMFLGFAALPPGHPLTPSNADASQLFMLYNVQ